eukprot:TRINITY_DN47300_c0_g1_i1.p1 TRINITY_DN47300_c0_g1~~TRINITY_DN47300_c0_g1_i1.p1  ORF type:complete len:412 (+),score=110.63 TRINITY_DN47300_c0_g1_i1:75-1238(+)
MVLAESCQNAAAALAWLQRNSQPGQPVLFACDIGATNTRMAVAAAQPGAARAVTQCAQWKCKVNAKSDLLRVLNEFARVLQSTGLAVAGASLCGPGPRDAAATRLGPFSNYQGSTNEERMVFATDLPTQLFPPGRSRLLNDLEAGAYGIAALDAATHMGQCFTKMWGPGGVGLNLSHGPYLVLAAGTGLGVGLIYQSQQGSPTVMPLEFGHVSVVCDPRDSGFIEHVKSAVKRGDKPPEYDDICTGRGLLWAWESVSQGKGLPKLTDPGEVAARALGSPPCAVAREAMRLHYKYLFTAASDLSMGFVLGGVILAGDNARHNSAFLADAAEAEWLRRHMLSHTTERMGFISRVTVLRQTSAHNFNLEGNFHVAEQARARAERAGRAKL